jgi:hypothetical protein
MKLLVFTIVLSLCAAQGVHSQNKILFSDKAYLDADEQRYILTEVKNVGQPGPDQVWDFSDLKNLGEVISYLKPVAGSPFGDQCENSNILIQEEHRSWLLRATPQGLEEYGVSSGQSVLIYDKPIIRFPFPFEYGSSLHGEYSGAYVGPPGRIVKGTFSTEADGFGVLILPDNVVLKDVIRVRFVQQRENSSGFITYRWYASNVDPILRYPLVSVITSFYDEQVHVIRAAYFAGAEYLMQHSEPYNLQDKPYEYTAADTESYELKVYPNPFVEHATVEFSIPYDAHVSLLVFDNQGRQVATLADGHFSAGKHTEQLSGTRQFIYYIRFAVNGEVIASRKLIQLQ